MSPCSCSCSGPFRSRLLLLFKFFVPFGFVLWVATTSNAQDKVELFGGYSYFRASIEQGQFGPLGPGTPCPPNCGNPPQVAQNANLNGWEFSAQYKFLPFFGGVVDFHGAYGKLNGGAPVNTPTFLVQISLPTRLSPFVHALFGFARESQDALSGAITLPPSGNGGLFTLGSSASWSSALGGGLDWDTAPFVAVRVVQIDSVHTHWHGASQNQPRVFAGIVFHF